MAVLMQQNVDLMSFTELLVDANLEAVCRPLAIALHVSGHPSPPNGHRPVCWKVLS
jgi:hypothetical protein